MLLEPRHLGVAGTPGVGAVKAMSRTADDDYLAHDTLFRHGIVQFLTVPDGDQFVLVAVDE